ncbi:MAG: protein kinase domain-containing protein [Planctomycetota bacterium]|jgi:hypothetical protein
MTQLTVTRGPSAGQTVTLSEDRSYLIGSAPDAALRVSGDGIAAKHLVVKALKAGGFGMKGLAGAFSINGRMTEAAKLKPGDRIRIGAVELQFGNAGNKTDRLLGGFRLLSLLGEGGMGQVYRAEQISLSREVALKVLSKDLTKNPVFVARFQAEAKAAARLHHPNVVQVFDVDHEDDTYFYSMELMSDGSLEDLIKKRGTVDPETATRMICEAARGLGYAESLRIVHRDIKPDNLMVDHHGSVKIADLGLAQSDEDQPGKLLGTPHFMSPEQALRKPLDHRSDLYSLGCSFYRLLTGKNPFPRASVKAILLAQVKEEPVPAHKVNSDIPSEIGEVISRLMEKDPDERYQSAEDLVEDLEIWLNPPVRRGLVYSLAGISLAAIVGTIFYVMNLEDPETKIITEFEKDPNAAIAIAREKETAAENAVLRLELRNLPSLEMASALEAVAEEHAGTGAAEKAAAEASRLRKEHAARLAADRALQEKLETELNRIEQSFWTAARAGDLRRAALTLDPQLIDVDLREQAKMIALLAKLQSELENMARTSLASLQSAITRASDARDIAAIRAAIAAAEQASDADSGWIRLILGQSIEIDQAAQSARDLVPQIAADQETAEEVAAWTDLRKAILKPAGVLDSILVLDFQAAGANLAALSEAHVGKAAGISALRLDSAIKSASRYNSDLRDAMTAGNVEVPLGPDGSMLKLVAINSDPSTGLSLRLSQGRNRPREQEVLLADRFDQLDEIFPVLGNEADPSEREGFLALLSLGVSLKTAKNFLAGIDATQLSQEFAGIENMDSDSQSLVSALSQVGKPEWAPWLANELSTVHQILAGLRAFATGRLRSADLMVTRILDENRDRLVVQSLL